MSEVKVAFPTNDQVHVECHFGHCKQFVIYTLSEGTVTEKKTVDAPPHAPGVIPAFVASQGATVVITGGMGQRAVDLFKELGVEVYLGAEGTIENNLQTYIDGFLVSRGSACQHNGEGETHRFHGGDGE